MSKMKHAVSLIVLVVTILVLAILAAAVIISLSNANIMSQASKTVFKSDMANFKETYEMYVISELADDANFDRSTLNVTYASDEFEDIFGANVSDKYKKGLQVVNGKLVYVTEDETEKEILEDLGIASSTTETPSTPVEPETPVTPDTPTDAISKDKTGDTSPYLGCYVKIGDEYGIIFADLLYGGEGTWSSTNTSTYKYDAVTDTTTLKDYVVNGTYTDSKFGTKDVLEVAGDTTGKQDRFYVMALSDITSTATTNNYFTWYAAAYDSGIDNTNSQVTSTAFGKGKTNTATMMAAWNDSKYGTQNDKSSYKDMWGVIQDKVKNGWFVPSKDEWSAFAVYLKGRDVALTTSNYRNTYELYSSYWSSSLYGTSTSVDDAWLTDFSYGGMRLNLLYIDRYVRLAATF